MNCDHAQLSLSARMDGEHLGERRDAEVDAHVEGCSACREFARGSLRVRTAVRIRPADDVPDLVEHIVGSLERASALERSGAPSGPGPRSSQRAYWRRVMPAAAAVVVGAVIGSVVVGGPFRGADPTAISGEGGFTGMEAIWNYFYWQTLSINMLDDDAHMLRASLTAEPDCMQWRNEPPKTPADEALFKKCNSYLGPSQPGIYTADPLDDSATSAALRAQSGKPATRLGEAEWAYFESRGEKRVRRFAARAT